VPPSGPCQVCKHLTGAAAVHVRPHTLPHTFGISYPRNGGSVFALQKTLGHTSLDTTLRYAALVTDDLVDEYRDHSPVAARLARPGQ
jgi:site-specific recombinase XerD